VSDDDSRSDRMRRQRRRARTPSGRGGDGGARLQSARGRKDSSRRWLERQLSDPYVAKAQQAGYRSRAAYKLIEIDDKHRLLAPGRTVVDLGAAPGGWCQVARERLGDTGRVIGLDLLELDPLPGVELLQGDITEAATAERLEALLDGPADVVLSDMAPNLTGQSRIDRLRVLAAVEAALDFAERVLAPGGHFLAKTLQAGSGDELMQRLKRDFAQVRHVKPPASRADSAESYVLATGYRGRSG
jgi:23S rRNA (uridine2552-2'-O)-methyltransferase